ncbi:uncharacterized protein EI97DRAFT_436717 [Westerdykella ornata]|uniref:BRCT domain-containing protein n=1 Tax=Westerdykella ornata TaxID=318751 RepID=A0A6A6JBR2_WESOR|nr:uncharacterized protein EI97DRAFT_436717 [Westerdykella ornata]KAF2272629.1 hypothetical protein EI97DRAFT_436717 [Westerdykella ornata]
MADAESEESTQLHEELYNDPDKLSQLLGQRVGASSSFRFTSTTEETFASATAAVPAPAPHNVAASSPRQEPVPTPRRAATNSGHVKPSLPKHNSAPTTTGVVEERIEAGKMYHSFTEGNVVGDTQPDSQIYKNWTSGLHAASVHDEGHGISLLNRVGEEEGDTTEGPQFIQSSPDVLQSPTFTSPMAVNDENNPETQPLTNGALTSPLKFETPAMAGRKRDCHGEMLSSAARTATTPGTALTATAFFPPNMLPTTNGMSLTQIFNATQAATSPVQGILPDEPVFQRLSPNLANARKSSPPDALSSPIPTPRVELAVRSSSEPKAEYITMKQSQERRLREAEQQEMAPAEQDSWEELERLEKQRARRKAREKMEQEAAKSLSKVTAPTLSSPAQRKRGRKMLLSPRKKEAASVRRSAARLSAYDGPFDDDELDQLAQAAAVDGKDTTAAESPGELSQSVPSTGPPAPANASKKRSNNVQVPRTSSHPQGTLSGHAPDESPLASASAQVQQEPQNRTSASQRSRRVSQLRGSAGSFTVLNSQPEDADFSSVPRPKTTLPSSPSTNQYSINQTTMGGKTGFTSQVISSSMPPMPPQSSSSSSDDEGQGKEEHEVDDEAVGSSPPPVDVDEDDVAYDEHNYDEHLSAGGNDEGHEALPDTDLEMDEDDVVSESEHGNDEAENDEGEQMAVRSTGVSNAAAEDHGIPETAKEDRRSRRHVEGDETILSSHPEDTVNHQELNGFVKPRLQRQSTIPESDNMEDTQPSLFPPGDAVDYRPLDSGGLDSASPRGTEGTVPFHTAQEQQSSGRVNDNDNVNRDSQNQNYHTALDHGDSNDNNALGSSREKELAHKPEPAQFRSLSDIANQPENQRSVDASSIDYPTLFAEGTGNNVNTLPATGSSPLMPSAKKRKITYNGKTNRFISPAKTPERSPSPTPVRKVSNSSPIQPTSSMQQREDAGAMAAENTRAAVASATLPTSITKASTNKMKKSAKSYKKGSAKTVGKGTLPKTSLKSTTAHRSRTATAAAPDPERLDTGLMDSASPQDQALPGPFAPADESDELAGSTPQPSRTAQPIAHANDVSDRGEEPNGPLLVPNRVFALWPGQGYYPATCLGRAGSNRVRIRYDEGSHNTVEVIQVRGLELRIGDQVKVDQPGMKKHVYIVVGLKDKISVDDNVETVLTDCRGYRSAVLEMRNRESLPSVQRGEQPAMVVTVPVEKIYLTNQLCGKYRDRLFNLSPPRSPSISTLTVATPRAMTVPASPSLSRRGGTAPSLLRESLRAASVASSYQGVGGTVFVNMAFAVTLQHAEDESEKHALVTLITSNGGQVLTSFSDLFKDFEDAEAASSRPNSAGKGKEMAAEARFPSGLELRQECKGMSFAALITDTHSRRSKYIQALALNIPCLHHRWLTDSIAASKPLPFAKYLLPAGVSTFLDPNGIVRSRNISMYDPASARLEEIIQKREMLLQGQSVLLITGKSKKDAQRKQHYLFLTHALGPRTVGRCADITAAKAIIQDGKWDWVHVDGGEPGLVEATQVLFGHSNAVATVAGASKNRKRKRDHSTEPEVLFGAGDVAGKKVRLVCDEFVIQSLILGAPVEE